MLENLTDLVKQYAGDTIINNPSIPNDRNDEAVQAASTSIMDGLKGAVSGGNVGAITDLFNGGAQAATSSPVTQNIQSNFVQSLVQKFGLDHGKASHIASALIPIVISKFVNKTNDPSDKSFDLSSILGSLTGGGGIGDMLKNFTGGNNNNKEDEGGLMGKIKGMFN